MGLLSYLQRQQVIDDERKAREQYTGLLGTSPITYQQSEQSGALMPQEGPTRPGEFLAPIPLTKEGSGFLGGKISPQEFYARVAGMPGGIGANVMSAATQGMLPSSGGEPSLFGGSGMDAQTFNTIINYNQTKQAGKPTGSAQDMAYNLAYQRASQPQRFMDPSGQMIEYPGMNLSGFIPPAGIQPQDRQSLGKKPKAAETAGKQAMIDTAQYSISNIEPALFKDGKVNAKAVNESWAINNFEPAAAVMSPEAQRLNNSYEIIAQAITRTETGAAMPKEEIQNTKQRFMPKPWDDDTVVRQKWAALNLFIKNVQNYLDPGNLTADAIFNKAMQDAERAAKNIPPPPPGFEVIR